MGNETFYGDGLRSHMNGSQPFESTIEQTTGTMPPGHKTTTAAAMIMTTSRITSLRELLHYCTYHVALAHTYFRTTHYKLVEANPLQ